MSGGKLEVQIGADITDFEKKIKEVEFDIKELSKVKLEKIKLGLDTTQINAQIKDAKSSLNGLKTAIKDTGGQISGQFTKQVGNGNNALMQFSRIAQDAPYGMVGIQNNLTATAEAFSYLKNSTGSTSGALKAMASSLMGTGGILLGVSLLTTGLTLLSQSGLSVGDVFNKIIGNVDAFKDALKKVNEEAYKDKGVQEVISNVNELTNEIDLAKKGFLDKDQVVNHYNETIGKTTGLVSSLDEAEKELVKNGDAYIKMTLYKAAANIALQEAGKQLLEAEKSRAKKQSEFTNAFLDADLTVTRSKEQYEQKQKNLQNQLKIRQQKEIKINEDAANANLSIAKKFQADAAKIAKDFKFNFFGDTKADKVEKTFETPQVEPLVSPILPEGLVAKPIDFTALTDSVKNVVPQIKLGFSEIEFALYDFNQNASEIINTSIMDTFAGIGTAIGQALSTGGNLLQALGASLLSSLGGVLTQMGKMAIEIGVGLLAVKFALKSLNPAVAIAAGVGLIALGSLFSSKSASIGGSMGGGKGGVGSTSTATGSGANNSSTTSGGGYGWSGGGNGTVVFEIAGTSLIGVLNNTTERNLRIGGR